MEQYIIMCRSLTYAQRASRVLERAGIFSGLTKAPVGLSPEGCTYGVKLRTAEPRRELKLLHDAGIKTGKVFVVSAEGVSKEVAL